MDRRSITVVVAVVLSAVWIAYSFGWFDRSRPAAEMQNISVSNNQALDQDKMKADAVPVTQVTAEAADTATE